MKHNCKKHYLLILLTSLCVSSFSQVQYSRKYRVTAYKNGNPSILSLSNEVEVIPIMTIYVPNTFTPNGDGLNDTFGVVGEAIKNFSLVIYDRWGQKVFEAENVNLQWDGTFNGSRVPQGSYSYIVLAQGLTGGRQTKKGTFNLIQ